MDLGKYDYFLSSTSTPGTNIKTAWASLEIKEASVDSTTGDAVTTDNPAAASSGLSSSVINNSLYERLKGKIILRVENHGEAWYINPVDGRRNFLARPADAFNIMRKLGAGISESDYALLGEK